ncbi:hypothetical protein SDC9_92644 [bioreactor metagenome]|uniref:Uncharacterized protein n=1 Tax=bioreactor metagenome TaxID=1076179 RepID=A0A644ZY96_9ZZZZ
MAAEPCLRPHEGAATQRTCHGSGWRPGTQMPEHQSLQQRQLSVKEMAAPWNDSNRKYLRARPVHDRSQWHCIVRLAMNDQSALVKFLRNRRHLETTGRRADEHDLLDIAHRGELCHGMAGDEGAKGEPRQRQRPFLGRGLFDHGQQIVQLAHAVVVHAFGGTHAAEVEAHRGPAALHEGARQRLHDLVVHGAAEQRVRMGNHRHAACGHTGGGLIAQRFDGSDGAGECQAFGLGVHVKLPLRCMAAPRGQALKKKEGEELPMPGKMPAAISGPPRAA